MKQFYYSMLAATLSLFVFASCSSGDDDGVFEISQLVGSEWKSSYEWLDSDDLSMESGTEVLVFISSTQAKKTTKYEGYGWDYNYNLGTNEYKSYSGTRYTFYEYTVSSNVIHLTPTDDYYTFDLAISGNNLIDDTNDQIWTLSKKGDGVESDETSSYSWSNMSGFWMYDEPYSEYASTIQVYKAQNAPSSRYLDNPEYGYFNCFGMHFNADGQMKEVVMETRLFENTLTLDRIDTSDGKTVYWTNIETGSYSGIKYTIHGNTIYYSGEPAFEIVNSDIIKDMHGGMYVRAK